jgi:hypothetical protein
VGVGGGGGHSQKKKKGAPDKAVAESD